jgi:hypothetical protein
MQGIEMVVQTVPLQAREKSLAEFRKRDDKCLATLVADGDFSANNYAK